MDVISIKEFATQRSFTQINPTIRTNTNGYPFLTFISADNKAENIYFSKKASVALNSGMPVTKEMLATYQVGMCVNEAGEPRIKLISNSERIDIASLLD